MTNTELKVGDLFHRSRGYDMTFNDFRQVVGLKGKSTVIVRKIANEIVDGHEGYSWYERPIKDGFVGEEEVYRVGKSGGIKVNDYDHAWKAEWDKEWYFNRMD